MTTNPKGPMTKESKTASVNPDELNQAISALIKDYLKKHPNLSVNSLADRCGLSESTLRRMAIGKTKTFPNPGNVSNLIVYIFDASILREAVKQAPEVIQEYIKKEYKFTDLDRPHSGKNVSDAVLEIFKDKVNYLIYTLVNQRTPLHRQVISKKFGDLGIQALDRMIEAGLLNEKNNVLFVVDKAFKIPATRFLDNFKHFADQMNENQPHDLPNLRLIGYEGLNEKAYLEIIAIQRDALLKMAKVWNDPASNGELRFFILSMIDLYI